MSELRECQTRHLGDDSRFVVSSLLFNLIWLLSPSLNLVIITQAHMHAHYLQHMLSMFSCYDCDSVACRWSRRRWPAVAPLLQRSCTATKGFEEKLFPPQHNERSVSRCCFRNGGLIPPLALCVCAAPSPSAAPGLPAVYRPVDHDDVTPLSLFFFF